MDDVKILEFAGLFAAGCAQLQDLNGYHNRVCRITGKPDFILRCAPAKDRSRESILAELDFILYLKRSGVSVAAPVRGIDGNSVYDAYDGDERWIITAFEVAEGEDFWTRTRDGEDSFRAAGRELGKIHRLSKKYQPGIRHRRGQWEDNRHLSKADALFEKRYPALQIKFRDYIAKMRTLPKNPECYGLIHGDYLFSNYYFKENKICIFDFDDCEYSWFISDIAVCLYYFLLGAAPAELYTKTDEAETLLHRMLEGYNRENALSVRWFENIDLFFQMRDYVLLSMMCEIPYEELSAWQREFFDGALDRRLNDRLFIEADFKGVYESVNNKS